MSLPQIYTNYGSTGTLEIDGYSGSKRTLAPPVILVDSTGHPSEVGGGIVFPKWFRNSSNSRDMNVNGSVTPVVFYVEPAAGILYEIQYLTFQIMATAIQPRDFGGGNALANGVKLTVQRETSPGVYVDILDILDGFPLKRNADFDANGAILQLNTQGANEDSMTASVNLVQLIGRHAEIDGDLNDRLAITIRDNLTGLYAFYAKMSGQQYIKSSLLV